MLIKEALAQLRAESLEPGDVVFHYTEPDVFGVVVSTKDPGAWNKAEIIWDGSEVSEWLFTKYLTVLERAFN